MNNSNTNTRKARCKGCKKMLLPGEGVKEEIPWFHGRGNYYFLCKQCKKKGEDKNMADSQDDDPQGVIYE